MGSYVGRMRGALLPRVLGGVFVLPCLTLPAQAANPITLENARPGTSDWKIDLPARSGEIQGYASLTSVSRGGTIHFYVSTAETSYTLEVFRLGWYGGAGGRRLTDPVRLTGTRQPLPQPSPTTGQVECRWSRSYSLEVPRSKSDPTLWPSGVYLAKLTAGTSGRQAYVIFVVRDDRRRADYLFQSAVTTYQAYNNWGGKSLYDYNSTGPRAFKVSFDRPYVDGYGSGHFLAGWGGWEYNMVRFLEREGYDVRYCTDLDIDENPDLLGYSKAFLSVGHDEYWTWRMRSGVEAARDKGIGLGFFGANACYWQVRLESNSAGQSRRTLVAYKESFRQDPYYTDGDPFNDKYVTTQWRLSPVNRPEAAMIGVMYTYDLVHEDIVVENTSHWVFQGTGLRDGDRLPGLLGYEVDAISASTPANGVRLAHSPFPEADGATGYSNMGVYTAASGATVFAAGTIWWSWGLDDYNAGGKRTSRLSAAAQQITRNVLARLAGR